MVLVECKSHIRSALQYPNRIPSVLIRLSFKNIELLKVRSIVDSSRSTVVANVNLEIVKNKEKDGKP
jgi:hypothetical protein